MKTNEILQLIGEQVFLDKVYQYAYRRCNTSHEAEDLCSDIILAVISAVHKQEHIDNSYAFVWTIARRVYADFSKKRSRAQQTVSIENEELSLPAKANEIDQFIEETAQREELRRIFREIAFLSKAYREVMVLYYLDEMKVADIARKLGISEAAVKQRLFSARNTVRKEVETMSERNLSLKPVVLGFIGTGNPTGNDPSEKAERILSQNLVYACKDKAKSAKELSEELNDQKTVVATDRTITAVDKISFSVNFNDKTEMNAKLTLADGYTAKDITCVKVLDAEGNVVETLTEGVVLEDGKVQFTYYGVKSVQMREMYYFVAYVGNQIASDSNGYSVEAYCKGCVDYGTEAMADMGLKCMYYGDSAYAYFN